MLTNARLFLVCLALGFAMGGPLAVQSVSAQEDAAQLRDLQSQVEATKARTQAFDRESARLADETRSLRRRLVAITARVLEKEAAVGEAESNLIDLEQREAQTRALFEASSTALVETVAALQIIQKNPPPAMLVKPKDALEAVRSSILLAEITPALKAQADELAFKLSELKVLRTSIEDQKSALLAADKDLASERKGLEKLLVKRQKSWAAVSKKAKAERARLTGLAKSAQNLEQLLKGLAQVVPVFPRMKPSSIRLPNLKPGLNDGGAQSPALVMSDGLEIALISKARGFLRPPVLGSVVSKYNRRDSAGGRTKGIQIATKPRAQVIAPFDGKIVFAGPYLSYGQLLIIEAGEGYHLLLAGMSRIDGVAGQRLLAGEPVGTMGDLAENMNSGPGGRDKQKNRNAGKPHLYFEMRKNGKPFDPAPWLAARNRRARG